MTLFWLNYLIHLTNRNNIVSERRMFMNQLKESYIKKSQYYVNINCEAQKEAHGHLNEAYENLGLAYIVRNIFHEERKTIFKLSAIIGVLMISFVAFEISIPTFLISVASFMAARKCTKNVDLRDQFQKAYPNKLEWLHKSDKEIHHSIRHYENGIVNDEKIIESLEERGKAVLYRHQLLCNSSDDMVNKLENLKKSFVCNYAISIEQLKEYRKLLIQFEKEQKAKSVFACSNGISSISFIDEENKMKKKS